MIPAVLLGVLLLVRGFNYGRQNADPFCWNEYQPCDHQLPEQSASGKRQEERTQAVLQGGANATHEGSPAADTADLRALLLAACGRVRSAIQ